LLPGYLPTAADVALLAREMDRERDVTDDFRHALIEAVASRTT
jgi:hypothetical protein